MGLWMWARKLKKRNGHGDESMGKFEISGEREGDSRRLYLLSSFHG